MTKADGYRRALRTLDEWEPFLLDRSGLASDPRWRVREAVAMALQRLGAADMRALLAEARRWAEGSDYECRAAAAALCERALPCHGSPSGR